MKKILLLTIFFIILAYGVYAAGECSPTLITDNCNVTGYIELNYSNTYYVDDAADDGFIRMGNANSELNCNGSKFIGQNSTGSRGISIGTGTYRTNLTVRNCVFKNFAYNYYIQRIKGLRIINVTGIDSINENSYGNTINDTLIDNLTIIGSSNDPAAHGLYISAVAGTQNITIQNSRFENLSGACLQINSISTAGDRVLNITIKNSYFWNCTRGINDVGSAGGDYYNNTFGGMSAQGLKFGCDASTNNTHGAYSSKAHNNFFYPSTYGYWNVYMASTSNKIYNNTFYGSGEFTLYFNRTKGDVWNTTAWIQENKANANYSFASGDNAEGANAEIFLGFNSTHTLNYQNGQFNITMDPVSNYPNSDLYNVSNGVLLGAYVSNYVVIPTANQRIIAGDYDCAKHFRDSGQSYSCNATSCYFTNTNCTFKTGRTS